MRVTSGYVLLAALAASGSARAEPTKEECNAAYEQGQRLRRHGKLIDARDDLIVCGRDPCPSAFQSECVTWLAEVEAALPTVVVELRGAASASARVLVDGAPAEITGKAVAVDPGPHAFRVVGDGVVAFTWRQVIAEGEKGQHVVLQCDPIAQRVAPSRRPPTFAIVFTSIGAIALGSFIGFGISGLGTYATLHQCPACSQSNLDYTHLAWDVADTSLAVSVVALGLATYLWIARATSHAVPTRSSLLPVLRF